MPPSRLLDFVHSLVNEGRGLTEDEARDAMRLILEGAATPVEMAAFVIALRMKGETVEELTGFARAMREAAGTLPLDPADGLLLDTCGTGGDGMGTFNISTLAAFVIAGAGVRVAKHGNRSISNRGGSSADCVESFGVTLALSREQAAAAIRETGIAFLFAPAFHPSMHHVQPVRLELKLRTAFNMLGPLTNPAGASVQLAGAFSRRAAELMAGALARLGLKRGFVVHGSDGLDEVTTTGPTFVYAIEHGRVEERTLTPEDFGVARARPEDLAGGDPVRNAEIACAVLAGRPGAARDIVLVNAALALVAAGTAGDVRAGMRIAGESIDSGAARGKVEELARFTRS